MAEPQHVEGQAPPPQEAPKAESAELDAEQATERGAEEVATVKLELEKQATEAVSGFKEESRGLFRRTIDRVFRRNKGAPTQAGEDPAFMKAIDAKADVIVEDFKKQAEVIIEPASAEDAAEAIELPKTAAQKDKEMDESIAALERGEQPEDESVDIDVSVFDASAEHGMDVDVSDFDEKRPAEATKEAPTAETAEQALARKERAYKKMVDREAELEEQIALADDVAAGRVKKKDLTPKQRKLIDETEVELAKEELETVQEAIGQVAGQLEADPAYQKKARQEATVEMDLAEAPKGKKQEKGSEAAAPKKKETAKSRADKEPKLQLAIDKALEKYDRALDGDRSYLMKLKEKGNPDDLQKAAGFLTMAQKQLEGWSAEDVLDNMVLTDEMTFADAEAIKEAGLAEQVKTKALEIRRRMMEDATGTAEPEPDSEKPLELGTIGEATGFDAPGEKPLELGTIAEATGFVTEAAKGEPAVEEEEAAGTAEEAVAAVGEKVVSEAVEAAAEAMEMTPEKAMMGATTKFRARFMRDIPHLTLDGYKESLAHELQRLTELVGNSKAEFEKIRTADPKTFLDARLAKNTISPEEYEVISKDAALMTQYKEMAAKMAQDRQLMVEKFLAGVPAGDIDRAAKAEEMAEAAMERDGNLDYPTAFRKAWKRLKEGGARGAGAPTERPKREAPKTPIAKDLETPAEKPATEPAAAAEAAAPEVPAETDAETGKSPFAKGAMKGIIDVMESSGLAETYKTLKYEKFAAALKNAGYDVPEGALGEGQMKKLLNEYRESQGARAREAGRKKR